MYDHEKVMAMLTEIQRSIAEERIRRYAEANGIDLEGKTIKYVSSEEFEQIKQKPGVETYIIE